MAWEARYTEGGHPRAGREKNPGERERRGKG